MADERAGIGLRCSVRARGAIVRRRSRTSIRRTHVRHAIGVVARVRRRQRAYHPVRRARSSAAASRYAVAEPRPICQRADSSRCGQRFGICKRAGSDRCSERFGTCKRAGNCFIERIGICPRAGCGFIERLDRFIGQARHRFAWSYTRSNATVSGCRRLSRSAGNDRTFRYAEAVALDEGVLAGTQPTSCSRHVRCAEIDARVRSRREQGNEPRDDGALGRSGSSHAFRCHHRFECTAAKERRESRRAACANCKRIGNCERIAHGSGAERTRYERRGRREPIRGDERNASASFA